ncbi:MAG: DUF3473 domain-containing protein [Desulfatitalea sp.]|nr:DUF3473 domain-containing protein [Desulfatitalea sp.]NNJ99973.1 DUF3473 domain-containing protein [Desulfatitalea sp.]
MTQESTGPGSALMHLCAMTVDVEDFDTLALRGYLGRSIKPRRAVIRGTHLLLERFAQFSAKATFFFLAEVAEAYPALVRSVVQGGHEIGVHGYSHRKFFNMRPSAAFHEVYKAKRLIEDIIGSEVKGHRAPAFSIGPDTAWAFEVLGRAGFSYDSSVMPFRGRRYGWPGFPERIQRIEIKNGLSLIEAPMPLMHFGGVQLPAGGGGYLRHFPYWYTTRALKRVPSGQPIIAYLHPYDVDTVSTYGDLHKHLRWSGIAQRLYLRLQYRNRHTMMPKLNRLMSDFKFTNLSHVIDQVVQNNMVGA